MTIRAGGNIGINEVNPNVKLHVSSPPSDPLTSVSLSENTGILLLGQIDDNNLVMDYRGIQARNGFTSGSSVTTASELGLQPRGGDIIIHSDASTAPPKAIITEDARLGLDCLCLW